MLIKALSQRDSRWASKKLGFSDLSIGFYGCTITVLTMLLNYVEGTDYTPDQVNEKLKTAKAFSDGVTIGKGALLVWARVPLVFPSLKLIKRGYNYFNLEVAWWVYVRKMPVMVEVNAASIGAPRHWVLFIGWGNQLDPWYGKMNSTKTYPLTGYTVYSRS